MPVLINTVHIVGVRYRHILAAARAGLVGVGGLIRSVRFQVVASMLFMMLIGLALTGSITFGVSFSDLNNRIDQSISDKAANVEKLARSAAPGSVAALMSQLHTAATAIGAGRHEVIAGLVGGHLAWAVEGKPDDPVFPASLDGPVLNLANPTRPVSGSLGAEKDRMRATVRPMGADVDGRPTFLVVARDTTDQQDRIVASIHTFVFVSLGALVIAGLIGSLFAGHLLRPLNRLREATEIVSHDDLSQRVHERGGADDVAQLARTFNLMLERLDDGAREQQRFIDDVGHELRTPLTILQGHLELMSDDNPDDVAETKALLLDELARMQRLVDDLLLLANAQRPEFVRRQELDVARFTDEVMEKVRVLAPRNWQVDESTAVRLDADPHRLTQALVQLAANAVKYTNDGATIAVGSRVEPGVSGKTDAGSEVLALWVRDTGTGIPPEDQERIFERFGRVETGRGENGAGLGLAIVTAIAEAHSGRVIVKSAPGYGSTFTLLIPLAHEEVAS